MNRSLLDKRAEYRKRQHKVIFLYDNTPLHSRHVGSIQLGSSTLPHAVYSPDFAPSDYHLFAWMGIVLAEQHFNSYEDVKKWFDEWFEAKVEDFPGVIFKNYPKDWKNV